MPTIRPSFVNNARLLKTIPRERLHLICGDARTPPVPGDYCLADQGYTGKDGQQMVLAGFVSRDESTEWEAEAFESELEPAIAMRVDIKALFDADELYRSGETPWTIFAYPTSIAVSWNLPPDAEATFLLAELQSRGIPMAVWGNGLENGTTYFACRHADRLRVDRVIRELVSRGIMGYGFLSQRSDYHFAVAEERGLK
ncbi:MAG: hypothetical protein R3C18_10605 [Planctomycetaceae bacterium]